MYKIFFILLCTYGSHIVEYADNLFRTEILVDVTRVDDTFRDILRCI